MNDELFVILHNEQILWKILKKTIFFEHTFEI